MVWSFVIGACLVLSFILLYGGLQHIQGVHSWWEVEIRAVLVTLIGSGLLLGCVAVIGKHVMKV